MAHGPPKVHGPLDRPRLPLQLVTSGPKLRGKPRVFAAVAAGHASSVPSRPKLPPPEDPPARSRSRSASGLSNVIRGSPAAGKFEPSPAPPCLGPSEDSPAAQPPPRRCRPTRRGTSPLPAQPQPAIPTPPLCCLTFAAVPRPARFYE
ncbi:uncharacterized protein LOC126989215 [Eriocheir sinensis]|uniref:uncharacterized protein LOC126989215 n=1 Tax=Eriocheir sinensis TaxID=95602 RepID=UPI0021C9DC81|nr:uncharacterized protein LOC126989215 [Eriocheir sinensis]